MAAMAVSLYILVAHVCFHLNLAAARFMCAEPKHQVLSVAEGTPITLPCIYKNISTSSNVYWYAGVTTLYANEEPITISEKYSLDYQKVSPALTKSSNLTILSAHRNDPLNYTCQARVGSCRKQEIFTVIVKYPASIHFIGPRKVPYWTPAEPGKISVNETENITLSCNSGGEPAPFINWTRINRDGEVMKNVSLADETVLGDLRLTNVSRKQSGIYRCKSINQFGNDAADVELVVQL
eukprot:XP_011673241.1 PREDICTED: vascular cell adhesion protein 1-like [Strongylocentrotus purpuratus]